MVGTKKEKMDLSGRLFSKIFPEIVKAGNFGADIKKFVSFDTQNAQGGDQFGSSVIFGDVTLEMSTGERTVQSVVIKTHRSANAWGIDSSVFFHNEVLFYSKVIPAFRKYDRDGFLTTCVAEFVYGKATNGAQPEEDIIILKNLNQKGFKLAEARFHLDEKHTKLALDGLAKFHALSLAYKMDDPKGFNELVGQIKIFFEGGMMRNMISDEIYASILRRGVEPLKKDPKYQDRLSDLSATFDNAIEHWRKCTLPSEPLTVIAHGDFNRSNFMFKYGTNGDPIEVAYFDFQGIRPSTPALDMVGLFFKNLTPEVRTTYWDEFLRTYHGTLRHQLDGYPKKPSLEDVELDIRKKGITGYYLCSFYIPVIISVIGGTNVPGSDIQWSSFDHEQTKAVMQKFSSLNVGGAEATELLVGIVKHMVDKNYIFKLECS